VISIKKKARLGRAKGRIRFGLSLGRKKHVIRMLSSLFKSTRDKKFILGPKETDKIAK
jgi:hypothetical protein